MNKVAGIISNLISDQQQPIILGKTAQEAWASLQEHFQHINPMSTSHLIYKATTKKLSDIKNIQKYTSHYQTSFDKVSSLLIKTSSYMRKSTKTYYLATMLMNIRTNYLALVLEI